MGEANRNAQAARDRLIEQLPDELREAQRKIHAMAVRFEDEFPTLKTELDLIGLVLLDFVDVLEKTHPAPDEAETFLEGGRRA